MPARVTRLLVSLGGLLVALAAVEGLARRLDGYRVVSLALVPIVEPAPAAPNRTDLEYVARVRRHPSVRLDWYEHRPPRIPRVPLTPEFRARADRYPDDTYGPFFEWNLSFLEDQACRGLRATTMGTLEDFYYFVPADGLPYPAYRHLQHVSPPNWFVTNNFGWRGPDIPLNKPPDTIRIAFVGASTTIDAYGIPFSHPEMIGHWLNEWAAATGVPYRFEVINAGRTGIDTHSIAAIVTNELLPVEPDIVVYYEGANQFWPGQMLRPPDVAKAEKPKSIYRQRTTAEHYFALARRVAHAVEIGRATGGGEPIKPQSTVDWPADVDEFDPPLGSEHLPMDLPAMVRDLETMRTALASIKAELVVSSFVWLVYDGMTLKLDRDFTLYDYLNRGYWPVTYAQMRRLADFQNRVFEKYAQTHGLPFFDIAAEYPQDPALAIDGVHLRYEGLSLQGWIFLQHLIPMIEERLADARLPKPQQHVRTVHPAFTQPSPRLIRGGSITARCH